MNTTNTQLFKILAEKHNLTHYKSTDEDYHCLYLKHLPLFSCNADGGLSLWQQNNLLCPLDYTPIDLNDPNSLKTIEKTIKQAKQNLNNYTILEQTIKRTKQKTNH